MALVYRLQYSDIFSDEPSNIDEIISGLDFNELSEFIVNILAFEYNNFDNITLLSFLLVDVEYRDKIMQRIEEIKYSKNIEEIEILDSTTLLRLFEYISSIKTKLDSITREVVPIDIIKIILFFNEKENTKTNLISSTIPSKYQGKSRINSLLLTTSIATQELSNFSKRYWLNQSIIVQCIKFTILFKFLFLKYPYLYQEFLNKYDFKSSREYLHRYLAIIEMVVSVYNKPGGMNINVSNDSFFEENCRFIDNFAYEEYIANISVEDKKDFDYFKSNPIRKISNGNYQIIHPYFVVQKIHTSIYFDLKSIYISLNPNIDPSLAADNFRRIYTYEYIEQNLTYSLLNNIFNNEPNIRFEGEAIKEDGAPDYYVRINNSVILFECKENLIPTKIKSSYDFNILENYFNKIFNGKAGIVQLVNNIKKVLLKKNIFDNEYEVSNLKIYPILITHRSDFDTFGINNHINYMFEKWISNLKIEGFNIDLIKPITIILSDVLVLHECIFVKNNEMILNLIDEYHDLVKQSEMPISFDDIQNYSQSFSLFLNNHPFIISQSGLCQHYLKNKIDEGQEY